MSGELFELAVRALADTYAEKEPDTPTEDRLREMISKATHSLRGRLDVAPDQVEGILASVLNRPIQPANFEYNRRTVARWFEVPVDEFDQIPVETLQADILFRHCFYEQHLKEWFEEWGYSVEIGEELEGIEGTDFIPDVYATLNTLHGRFQVAVTLFCGSPPNTWRVLGMLENIEAFAPKGSEFAERDIYLMVTPFKFLEQASNHIRLQCSQEDYYVVALEGNDLQDLELAQGSERRMGRLQDLVAAAARAKGVPAY